MAQEEIKLYYKNVMAEVIGAEHGITAEQFDDMAVKTSAAIKKVNRDKAPYRDLAGNTGLAEKIKQLAAELRGHCDTFVVLGIGGSALGNIALQTALNPYMYNVDDSQRKGPRFFVFDNVDTAQLASFLDWAGDKLDRTIFNVISKSGRTAETASQMLIIRQLLLDKFGADGFAEHVIATTDPNEGTLRNIANDAHLKSLEVPQGVGGRFSVLSAVGLFGACMCGIDIDSLLAGAADMDVRVKSEDFRENPAAINAAINYHYYNRGKVVSVMMPYSYALKDFADWYRQLWAESLGKALDLSGAEVHVGATPVKALGTTDQHSQVQLYREGPNDKLFTFLQVNNFERDIRIAEPPGCAPELGYLGGAAMSSLLNSEKKATEYALLQSQRPCMTVVFEKVDAYAVGQFIYLYEVTTSIAGVLFGIDPYNQPAVELGKEATFALMGRSDYAQLAEKIRPYAEVDGDFLV